MDTQDGRSEEVVAAADRDGLLEVAGVLADFIARNDGEWDVHHLRWVDYLLGRTVAHWRKVKVAHGFTTTGRKRPPVDDHVRHLKGKKTVAEIARQLGISRTTAHKLVKAKFEEL